MAIYLANNFPRVKLDNVSINPVSQDEAEQWLRSSSVINTITPPYIDDLIRNELGFMVNKGRALSINLGKGDSIIIAQYTGPVLQKYDTELPTGSKLNFWVVQSH